VLQTSSQNDLTGATQNDVASLRGDAAVVQNDAGGPMLEEAAEIQHDVASLQGDASVVQNDAGGPMLEATEIQDDVASLQGDASVVQNDTGGPMLEVTEIQDDVASLQGDASVVQNDAGGPTLEATEIQDDVASLQGDAAVVQNDTGGLQCERAVVVANDPGPSPGTSKSTFWNYVVIPHRTKRNGKPRKKAPYNLTGEKHFEFMAEKEKIQRNVAKPSSKANSSTQKVNVRRSSSINKSIKSAQDQTNHNRPEKRQLAAGKPAKDEKQKKKGAQNQDAADPCIFCCESTTATGCIQCQVCKLWAHYECTDVDKGVYTYVCDLCQ